MRQHSKMLKKILFAAWACHNKNYTSYQAWYIPLTKVFREVVTFDPQEEIYHHGREKMNASFLELVRKEKPDYLFLWLIYDEFDISTLLHIKKISPKTKMINFFGDDDVLFYSFSRYYAALFEGCLVNQRDYLPRYKEEGIKNVFITYGVNTDHFRPLDIPKKYDVTFIGTPKRDRYEFIMFLLRHGIDVRVFGSGWEQYPELRKRYGGQLSYEKYLQVINESRINLSFSKNYEGRPHFKGRVPEVCACRAFALSEYYFGYLDLFKKNNEIVMFATQEDLLKKVKYYLAHEREREIIAGRAYSKIIKNFALTKELRAIFNEIIAREKNHKPRELPPIHGEVIRLHADEIFLSDDKIAQLTKGGNYITFVKEECSMSPYKEYLHLYSLQKSKKPISCCDYHVTVPSLDQYLTFQAKYAFAILPPQKILPLLHLQQLMIKRNYFLAHLKEFRQFAQHKNLLPITNKNTVFISIPLVEIKDIPCGDDETLEKVFLPKYENILRSLSYKRKLFTSSYLYRLLIFSILHQPFIIRHLFRRFMNKTKILMRKKKCTAKENF